MKEHNPANLTPEQIGVSEGWRLLNEDEIIPDPDGTYINELDAWSGDGNRWFRGCLGYDHKITYRTKLTPSELRQARGLESVLILDDTIAMLDKLIAHEMDALRAERDAAIRDRNQHAQIAAGLQRTITALEATAAENLANRLGLQADVRDLREDNSRLNNIINRARTAIS